MKSTTLFLLGGLMVSASAPAADPNYQDRLSQVQKMNRRLDEELKRIGFHRPTSASMASGALGNPSEDEKKRPQLFQLHESAARVQAPAGRVLFGRLQNRLIVGPETSPTLVILSEGQGVFSGQKVLGRARQSGTSGRVQIELDRIVLASGRVQAIKGIALDQAGSLGLEAEVFSSKAWSVAGAMGSSFVSGLAAAQQSTVQTPYGFSQTPPTGRNALLQGLAQTAADQSKRLIEDATQERPVLVVEPGTPVSVYLDEEVRF